MKRCVVVRQPLSGCPAAWGPLYGSARSLALRHLQVTGELVHRGELGVVILPRFLLGVQRPHDGVDCQDHTAGKPQLIRRGLDSDRKSERRVLCESPLPSPTA